MAYVPPHLRRKQEAEAPGETQVDDQTPPKPSEHPMPDLPMYSDIHEYFWPAPINKNEEGPDASGYPSTRERSTLNPSADSPDSLRYIMLFKDANPRWNTDKIIFVKTNLDLLPQESAVNPDTKEADVDDTSSPDKATIMGEGTVPKSTPPDEPPEDPTKPSVPIKANPHPIAVFEQHGPRKALTGGAFNFIGYHRIVRLQYLEPNSSDLVRMLEQKFSRTDRHGRVVRQKERDPESWKKSLGMRWAVIKFEKDEKADRELGTLDVPRSERRRSSGESVGEESRKGVNEMLREMRLEGGKRREKEVKDAPAEGRQEG